MRCYLVTGPDNFKTFCGTAADVRAVKKDLMAGEAKRKDIQVSEVEMPDDKAGKLAFLNKVLNGEV
jgi:hypothetical protein